MLCKRVVSFNYAGEGMLQQRLDKFKAPNPERYLVFAGINWSAWSEKGDGFGDLNAQRLLHLVDG